MKGILDPSFGPSPPALVIPGVLATPFLKPGEFVSEYDGKGVALQHDKKIVVAGSKDDGGAFAVARYDYAGKLDPSFGGGVVETMFNGNSGHAYALVIEPSGTILAVGFSIQPEGTDWNQWICAFEFRDREHLHCDGGGPPEGW